ncbi:protein TIFY 10A [Rhododendron vialii]|uniref:protein TIFY 10A n=1 Tax=Rhododendron vialii TaxID=182163 RepID=UPI00265EADFC|nr:protein TIFY 10A [Rhododendron vialii]
MSSSSEIADSGRFAGQRPEKSSNFSQTCSLLSQYLKEKGSFGDLGLGMSTAATATTMNLFPMAEKPGEVSTRNSPPMSRSFSSMDLFPLQSGFDSSVKKSEPETAQMTIFYAGQVIVFNDLTADKAKEVMLLASKGSTHNSPSTFASTAVQKPNEQTNLIPTSSSPVVPNFGNNMMQECIQRAPQPIVSDLPIARKASLTRFLEKRKDRITAKAPYQTSNSKASPPKPAESKSWLGLAAQPSVQFEPQF